MSNEPFITPLLKPPAYTQWDSAPPDPNAPPKFNKHAIGGVLVLLSLLFFILSGVLALARQRALTQWTRVEATVLSTQLYHNQWGDDTPEDYGFRVRISYPVSGEIRQSQILYPSFRTQGEAKTLAANFPRGRSLQIMYDPLDPKQIVLPNDIDRPPHYVNAFGLLKFGLCLLVVGMLLIFRAQSEQTGSGDHL